MKNYKVSILLSIYQVEEYLAECLNSILNQTYRNIEVVCVDNGSKDKCHIILEEYKAKDNRIKIITLKENQKLCTGRNVGLDNSTGDYILFVDPDDILGPNYVDFMLSELEIAIKKNKSKPVYLVLNQNAYNFSLKSDSHYNNLEEIVTKSNIFLFSNIFEGGGYFLDLDEIAKNPNYELCIPMWGRLYESAFLKESNIRFLDGEMTDNIPFTYLVLYKIKKEWLSSKTRNINNYYLRRMDDINVKDIEYISTDPSGNGATTSKVLYLETKIPYYLEKIYKECPGFRVPFTNLFFATYPRHRNKMKLLQVFKNLFKSMENTVINDTKAYSRLDVNLLQAVLSSNYTEFDKLAYPSLFSEYQNYQIASAPKSTINSLKKVEIFSYKFRLFNFIQIFKVTYFKDGKIFFIFGLPLIKVFGVGRKRKYYLFGIPIFLFKTSNPHF